MGEESTHDEYAKHSGLMAPMGMKIEALIGDIIASEDIAVHSIKHRVKTEASAGIKVSASPTRYSNVSDLHDFLGVRVITHLLSDVDAVVAALRRQFSVDEQRSFDKQTRLDADRFGYLSFHLVVKVDDARATLPEWAPYVDRYFEIQVRSILQHAWAEIEHDLGYKSTSIIPPQVKRRFARLAGLLEIADSEFVAIAGALEHHANEVRSEMNMGRSVQIDSAAVRVLVASDDALRRIDDEIAKGLRTRLQEDVTKLYADSLARHLTSAGFISTDEVSRMLRENSSEIRDFALDWITSESRDEADPKREYLGYSRGIGLFYTAIHHAFETSAPEFFDGFSSFEDHNRKETLRNIHDATFHRSQSPK